MYWGRRLRVTFYRLYNGINETAVVLNVETLAKQRGYKIVGTVTREGRTMPPFASFDIYNLSANDILAITNNRYAYVNGEYKQVPLAVKIEAGYTYGDFGVIFNGEVLKPTMQRPQPQDKMLHIEARESNYFLTASTVLSQSFNDGVNFYDIANSVIKQGIDNRNDFSVYIADQLRNVKVDGSFSVKAGSLYQALNSIADETGYAFSIDGRGLQIDTFANLTSTARLKTRLNSATGMVGIPTLDTQGISCTSLLNHKFDIFGLVELDNAEISLNQTDYLVTRELGAELTTDGVYVIVSYQHSFDTATGAFQTTMRCLAPTYLLGLDEGVVNE